MSEHEISRIKEILKEHNLEATFLTHEPVIRSEEAAAMRGFHLKQGVKALLFTNKKEFIIANIPGDAKVDVKKLALICGWKKSEIRMATPEEVKEQTGCDIGAVPPVGHKETLTILIDPSVYNNEINSFNIGLRTHSLKIKTSDFKKLMHALDAQEADIIKEPF